MNNGEMVFDKNREKTVYSLKHKTLRKCLNFYGWEIYDNGYKQEQPFKKKEFLNFKLF